MKLRSLTLALALAASTMLADVPVAEAGHKHDRFCRHSERSYRSHHRNRSWHGARHHRSRGPRVVYEPYAYAPYGYGYDPYGYTYAYAPPYAYGPSVYAYGYAPSYKRYRHYRPYRHHRGGITVHLGF